MADKEKPWNIDSWEELRQALAEMRPRTKLYDIVKSEMEKRGRWKKRPKKFTDL
jgi:hypothetical protein